MNMLAQLPYDLGAVRLRALREADFAVFLGYRSDPLVARYQGWWPMDEAKARTFLREQSARAGVELGGWVQLAIADAASDALLGDIGVWISHDRSEAELGITVAPSAQGRGIGRNAMSAALALLFSDPVVARVHANADARNAPCRRMLVAAGFREVGTANVFVKEEACIEHQYVVERGQHAQKPEEHVS
jgi:RimJ/RimL family protein N-acetyltransferase